MAINDAYFVMPINMERVCRVCLQENPNLTPIFSNNQDIGNVNDLPQKIQICGAVECHEQDGLPALICDVCIYKATVAHEFRQLCQHSDTRLRLFYNKPAKYNAMDSGTQTELQANAVVVPALLHEPTSDLHDDYFIKREVSLNSHQPFHNGITGEEFNTESQDTPVDVAINVGDGTFDVHLDFEDQQTHHLQDDVKDTLQSVKVNGQDLLPVPLIDDIVSKDEVGYFTYEIAKEVEKSMEIDKDNKSKDDLTEQSFSFASSPAPLVGKESLQQQKEEVEEVVERVRQQQQRQQQQQHNISAESAAKAKPNKCGQCSKSFRRIENLERHLATVHGPNGIKTKEILPAIFKCEECSQRCSTLKNLKRHQLIHGERKYSCTVCKKWFFRPDTLKKHAERHGHSLLDNLTEPNDLFDSDDNDNVNENMTKKCTFEDEFAIGEYKCQHCDKIMTTKKGLRRHVAMHKPKPEPAICEICKKVCASYARLQLHQKTHKPKDKPPREYLCHICSKVYPSNSSLTYHMRTHSGVKPHVCKTCNSGFTTTTSLTNHMRIHTGDRPFVCHVCSAAFAVSSAFRRHLTRHTGEANYLCKTCGKAFKRLSTLKEHTYTHSGEKPYICKTCGAAYSHSGSLFAHQKRCRAATPISHNNHHHHHHHQQVIIVQQDENQQDIVNHIHVNNVQSAVRSLAVIGQIF